MKKIKKENIEVAPTIDIESYNHIAVVFFPEILDMDYADVLITDESSLSDFGNWLGTEKEFDDSIDELVKKIEDTYKITISDLKDLKLVEVFKRIEHLYI